LPQILTLKHALWDEFANRLYGPEGCDVKGEGADMNWKCDGTFCNAISILTALAADIDIPATLAYLRENGAYCDCEILLNIGADEF
jgi:hypothetical protein